MDFFKSLEAPTPVFPNDTGSLVVVKPDSTVAEGFKALTTSNVLSAPVFAQGCGPAAILTMRDIVLHALSIIDRTQFSSGVDVPAVTFLSEKERFRGVKVKEIIDGKGSRCSFGPDAKVDEIVRKMVAQGDHRALVLNREGIPTSIITQSRLIEVLNDLFDVSPTLLEIGKKSLGELNLGRSGPADGVIHVLPTDTAADAFRLMASKNISAVAVIDSSGALIGNISERDLRGIKSNGQFLRLLFCPVSDFLLAIHPNQDAVQQVVTCTLQETYQTVVNRLVSFRLHRAYVLEGANVIGVVTLTDVLKTLVDLS